jgi:hypothetical protein
MLQEDRIADIEDLKVEGNGQEELKGGEVTQSRGQDVAVALNSETKPDMNGTAKALDSTSPQTSVESTPCGRKHGHIACETRQFTATQRRRAKICDGFETSITTPQTRTYALGTRTDHTQRLAPSQCSRTVQPPSASESGYMDRSRYQTTQATHRLLYRTNNTASHRRNNNSSATHRLVYCPAVPITEAIRRTNQQFGSEET